MILVRVVTVIGIVLSVVAILIQNQSPTLALVFLGMRSHPLPLGFWMAGAVVLGMLVSLGLLAMLSGVSVPRRSRRRNPQGSPFKRPQAKSKFERTPAGYSDWEEPVATDWTRQPQADPFFNDDYDYDDDPVDYSDEDRYDDPTPPWEKRDSSYSFSYRDPEFASQTSQRESVFDAEYRVINPPSPPEDWDEFEDQFQED
ncbi:hypothetical protein [Acaryochloris sp. IP29b_bin.148]|uniref:hypothetical protein n=1 Tax=Acaryochloris sp. IP29b_bin.148 TaxID=2969218 RepID=UPI00262171A8|nr:hypothetical protein [Acaryochloris sp. IP29b_bin.148]